MATAPPASRMLLVEVPGSWGRAGLMASRLPAMVSAPLAAAADAAGVRVQLIRRPGRHPGPRHPGSVRGRRLWALAEPSAGVVRWGSWDEAADLLSIDLSSVDLPSVDLTRPLSPGGDVAGGVQRLALVCTHARHDVCCAVRGRPVAVALAAAGLDREVWETSHLGGDRFAANLLLLPEGELFGGLDEVTAVSAAEAVDAGRLDLAHYRGRVGTSPVDQALRHLAAVELGNDRRGAISVLGVDPAAPSDDGRTRSAVVECDGVRYLLELTEWWSEPEQLTCAAVERAPARRFALHSLRRL